MATGLDELIDFLLSEIALCGTQGAGSADFRRFVHNYFQTKSKSNVDRGSYPGVHQEELGHSFYQKTWNWVVTHPDIRILHHNKIQHYSLEEFESAEQHQANVSDVVAARNSSPRPSSQSPVKVTPAHSLLSLRGALRKRLPTKDGGSMSASDSSQLPVPPSRLCFENDVQTIAQPRHRRPAEQSPVEERVFDEPSNTATAPRLYGSQSRIWQALTGHSMDLKKVPTMEFALLSLIAANGPSGLTQPQLTQYSGQDKRSVPHRTDELARKGYIVKKPVQAGKARTSLCVHSKFVSENHFTASGAMEDVFREGQFVASGFTILLYNTFKDAGVVLTRDIRKRLGVPMRTWNKRAVQGALIRLDQTGMIKRFRIRKKKSEDSWAICIQVLREPRPEDIDNLGFKRQAHVADTAEELLNDDADGDSFMRDLEVDMLDDEGKETTQDVDEDVRIPPQWTPERLLSNTIFELVTMGGIDGLDAVLIRDRVVGPFWRRPTESYLHRLCDDWERTQPPYLRHLAIVRDSRNTEEKKFVHYVYRTYEYFRQAVLLKEATWDGVQKPLSKVKKPTGVHSAIDEWGFNSLDQKDFVRFNGTASLADARSSIVSRKYGPRWDIELSERIGYQKAWTPAYRETKQKRTKLGRPRKSSIEGNPRKETTKELENWQPDTPALDNDEVDDHLDTSPISSKTKVSKATKTSSGLRLTPEERIRMGLKPSGRLSKEAVEQILVHRQETGDPTSLPDKITTKPVVRNGHAPLLTMEERIAKGLPPKGRLGIRTENKIREERGLPKHVKKPKRKSQNGEAVISKQQRIALGFNGGGRLHQHFIDALRKEQEEDIPLESSPAVEAYRQYLKDEEEKKKARGARKAFFGQHTPGPEDDSQPASDAGQEDAAGNLSANAGSRSPSSKRVSTKRKASDVIMSHSVPKRQHTLSDALQQDTPSASPQLPGLTVNAAISNGQLDAPQNTDVQTVAAATMDEARGSPQRVIEANKFVAKQQASEQPLQHSPAVDTSSDNDVVIRSSPGVYVYPFAKRKAARGRPRNACIVVFRSSRLRDLASFQPQTNSEYESSTVVSMGLLKAPIESRVTQNEENASTLASAETLTKATSPATDVPGTAPQSRAPAQLDLVASVVSEGRVSEEAALNLHGGKRDVQPLEANSSSVSTSEAAATPSQSCSQQLAVVDRVILDPEIHEEHADITSTPTPVISGMMPMAGWNAVNSSIQVTKPSYQSPYAPIIPPKIATPAPRLDDPTTIATPIATRQGTSEPETDESSTLPQGVISPIADHVDTVIPKKSRAKGTGPGIAGSQRSFRRAIILQVLERCGYVFPLHGEMWRPFSALWDQQHGSSNLIKPGSSAVFDALNEMIREPQYGLKVMHFRVNAKNANGSKERMIVAKKEMDATHPAVKRLAYGMANHSLEKSHQYYPKEIRDLFEYQSLYTPLPVAPKDESMTLEDIQPKLAASRAERMRERRERIKREKAAAKQRNKQVEETVPRRRKQAESAPNEAPREKRTRLASLNSKKKQWRWAPIQIPVGFVEASREVQARDLSPADTESSEDVPLKVARPLISDIVDCGADDGEAEQSDLGDKEDDVKDPFLALKTITFTHPVVLFHATTGTFSTSFDITTLPEEVALPSIAKAKGQPTTASKSRKRIRIDSSAIVQPNKRVRINHPLQEETLDDEFVYSSSADDSDVTSSEDEEDMPRLRQKRKAGRPRVLKRQNGKKDLPAPTLLQRLTGLTGDPKDPIYKDPRLRQKPGYGQPWSEKNKKKKQSQANKLKKEREYAGAIDHTDEFKKLCLTMVLASSMSGEDGVVDWNIVEKVYVRDKFFDLIKVKKLWTWMRTHMATQLAEMVIIVQSKILVAYEAKKLPTIDDPETYDWAGLVRWTMRTCTYPELPLPLYREALAQFNVDESRYATVDRTSWYGKKIADATRTHLQLQLAFIAPLHEKPPQDRSDETKFLKARSWTRANIATPQIVYNAKLAHEKLKVLGEGVLAKVVGNYVQEEQLKMRKLKRQLPGRNYTFTKKFAKAYKRPFEVEDFMVATILKKELDTTFANSEPEKRFYSISRCEEDGSIMAIMSLAADGKVKLVPQLPPVNDEFGAPLPRLSKWGFCEGDYIHRAIDRNRLFWDTHVVPTSTYQFGSPLHPLQSPVADWPSLAEPPLPGKHNSDALLPIWSSIDGQTITWPWWYRILNLVLQPLFLQPGATSSDVFSHCAEHTTELFEVELVLGWLESVGAVTKIIGGGYQATASFWAAFGDRLLDTEDDWFGEHVKRKNRMTTQRRWRDKYNLRYASMQKDSAQTVQELVGRGTRAGGTAMGQHIAGNAKAQYRILQQAMLESVPSEVLGRVGEVQSPATEVEQTEQGPAVQEDSSGGVQMSEDANMAMQHEVPGALSPVPDAVTTVQEQVADALPAAGIANTPAQDQEVDMVDADEDADAEGEDEDAEGEVDDLMY